MVEKGPRPTPEQDLINKLVERKGRIDDLRLARRPIYERLENESSVIDRVSGELAGASLFLLREIEARVVEEASGLLGPTFKTGFVPRDLFRDLGVEPITAETPKPTQKEAPKKKRAEKSRGLKDARPVEFTYAGKIYRGKEGKTARVLSRGPRRPKAEFFKEAFPGVKPKTANDRLNRALTSLRGKGWKIMAEVDHKAKETYYTWWKEPKARKKG